MTAQPPAYWIRRFSEMSDPLDAQRVARTEMATESRKLWLGVMYRAWLDLSVRSVREREEARAWFWSDDGDHPLTFASLCDVLGLSAARIREASLRELAKMGALSTQRCALAACRTPVAQTAKHQRFCSRGCQQQAYHLRRRRQLGVVEPFKARRAA